MKQLLTKAQAAKRANVDRAIITRKTHEGNELFPALVDGKIDAGHPAFKKFLSDRGVDPTPPTVNAPQQTESDSYPDDGSPQIMVDVQGLTLREIGDRFGGQDEFSGWLKAIKLTEEIREKRLKNDETDGSMIDRELVEAKVFGLIDETFRRLLTDATVTATRRAYANAKAGVDIAKAETETRDAISTTLGDVKKRVARNIRDECATGDKGSVLGEGAVPLAR